MWYNRVIDSLDNLPGFIEYYELQLEEAKFDCKISGIVEKNLRDMPGNTEHRFNQLQEIEAVLNFMNIQLRKIRSVHFKKYLETYQRALTSRDVEKYVDGEAEVIDYEVLINTVALLRNKWIGILKALESKNFMIGHIVRLRTAGMEDVIV